MALLTGQIIYNDVALTGTLELSNEESITKIDVLNGYFEEINIPEGTYQALLISEKPDGTVPEVTVRIPMSERVTWAELFEEPKSKSVPAHPSQPPMNKPVNPNQIERLKKLPPPELNPREGSAEEPDYWQREEFVQSDFTESEELAAEEPEKEVEEELKPTLVDRKTKLLIEIAARRRK
jgi:hypothetical protein